MARVQSVHFFQTKNKMTETILLVCLIESLVKEKIVRNVRVLDLLACHLDQPSCFGKREVPIIQYWPHLAEEFEMSEDTVIKCQHNCESSPSKSMLEFQEGCEPQFTVLELKGELKDIGRNDLAKKLEQCNLPGKFLSSGLKSTVSYGLLPLYTCDRM